MGQAFRSARLDTRCRFQANATPPADKHVCSTIHLRHGAGDRIGRDRLRRLRPVCAAAVRAGAEDSAGWNGWYRVVAMLLAKDDPGRVLNVSREPQLDFENEGFVGKVVFSTGVLEEDGRPLIYYGASGKYCAMVEVSRREVMRGLK